MDEIITYTFTESEKERIISLIKGELEGRDDIIFAYIYGSIVDPEMTFYRDIDIGFMLLIWKRLRNGIMI